MHLSWSDSLEKQAFTTQPAQENNTTFSENVKLAKHIINQCNEIITKNGIKLRQIYKRLCKQFLDDAFNSENLKRIKNKLDSP